MIRKILLWSIYIFSFLFFLHSFNQVLRAIILEDELALRVLPTTLGVVLFFFCIYLFFILRLLKEKSSNSKKEPPTNK